MKEFIVDNAGLTEACGEMRAAGVAAVDTEFVWMRTYRPVLGIVQFGCGRDACGAADCLKPLDPAPLGALIADGSVVKILHDAHQDLALLHAYTGALPANVFDTRLAAAFAGHRYGIGLQKLLAEEMGIELPKTETRTDWTRRPLSPQQLEYALDDVRYLPELREKLLETIAGRGMVPWLEEDLAAIGAPESFAELDPAEAWHRVKLGPVRLDPRGFAVLRAVAAARENFARKWNMPRSWVTDDITLAEIARDRMVGKIVHRGLRGGMVHDVAAAYETALADALALRESEWPEPPSRRPDPKVRAAVDSAVARIAKKAEELKVDPQLVASRADVTTLVTDPDDESNPLTHGWRREAVGEELLGIL